MIGGRMWIIQIITQKLPYMTVEVNKHKNNYMNLTWIQRNQQSHNINICIKQMTMFQNECISEKH
jgi:hypothetical protein